MNKILIIAVFFLMGGCSRGLVIETNPALQLQLSNEDRMRFALSQAEKVNRIENAQTYPYYKIRALQDIKKNMDDYSSKNGSDRVSASKMDAVKKNIDGLIDQYTTQMDEANTIIKNNMNRKSDDSNKNSDEKNRLSKIGQQICRTLDDITLSQPIPYVIYGAQQYHENRGVAKISGFVEGATSDKIQIRISGITFINTSEIAHSDFDVSNKGIVNNVQMDSMNGFKGSTLRINGIIWDDYSGWSICN